MAIYRKSYQRSRMTFSSGLLYTHIRINDNTKKAMESASFLYALVELLNEKGIVSIEELGEQKKQVAERLVRKFTKSGIGLMYQDPEYDKYAFEHEAKVDCQSRLHICKAICCKFPFTLSRQDVDERIIRWDFGRPYLIAHDTDGILCSFRSEDLLMFCTHTALSPAGVLIARIMKNGRYGRIMKR